MSPRTKRNLDAAMHCDAIDAATYSRFAARARMDDEWELAKAFQETADNDRVEHFAMEAALERLVRTSPENLRTAIDAERKEAAIYAEYARQAVQDGDDHIAAAFQKISRDKAGRCARFEAILSDMGVHSSFQTLGN